MLGQIDLQLVQVFQDILFGVLNLSLLFASVVLGVKNANEEIDLNEEYFPE